MSIHFITYSDERYSKAGKRILKSANESGWFQSCTKYSPKDVCNKFISEMPKMPNGDAVFEQGRGGGYWIWKPYIVKKKFDEINDGDILVYADAGCTINPKGSKRFQDYIKMTANKEVIAFQLARQKCKKWTTKEIYQYFDVLPEDKNQIIATLFFLKKGEFSKGIVDLWYNTAQLNPILFTDEFNDLQQNKYFKDNRHDQSIFSVILRKMTCNKLEILWDETHRKTRKNEFEFPFSADRKKS